MPPQSGDSESEEESCGAATICETQYATVKLDLASDPTLDIDTYLARKSAVLQKVLAESDLSADERRQILQLNDPTT